MDLTTSVSKGCFVFKNNKDKKEQRFQLKKNLKCEGGELYYQIYMKTLTDITNDIEKLKEKSFLNILPELIAFVENAYSLDDIERVLPTAALLIGINQPDHQNQFITLAETIIKKTFAKVCTIQSTDCTNLKSVIETMVFSFVENEFEGSKNSKRFNRSQCTMRLLTEWYTSMENNFSSLVVIIPDFECLNVQVFQDFVVILHSYVSKLPIILILGVATALSVLESTLPYNATNKLSLKIFRTQSTTLIMNQIFENIILPKFVFHLSYTTVTLLKHIFLCYDFSLNGLIQGLKYCVMEHFFQGNTFALCTNYQTSIQFIKNMSHNDLESIRQLMSFRPYVESINDKKIIISLLTDDNYLKEQLPNLLLDCHLYFIKFRIFIEFITILLQDLPKHPLGRHCSEIYYVCMSKNILDQPEFKECLQIISFMSKDMFVDKILKAISQTNNFLNSEIANLELGAMCHLEANQIINNLKKHLEKVKNSDYQEKNQNSSSSILNIQSLTRQNLKENLLKLAQQQTKISKLRTNIKETLEYICSEIISKYLVPLKYAPPLHEIFIFNDVPSVRRNIIGAPRAALHTALNSPNFYLQCDCCSLEADTQIVPTLPDLSIVYKLHLECGRMINLFDWLQAYSTVVDTSEEENKEVDPKIQARFAGAVAELQFLGYIKTTKRKTDHVARLTW